MSVGLRIYTALQGDRVIWMIVALLSLLSILVVYSSTGTLAYKESGGNTEAYLIKHGAILMFGLVLLYVCYSLPYGRYKTLAPFLLALSVPLLFYTVFWGPEINEARRWIQIPIIGLTFQTSDFAKLALVLYLATKITDTKDYINDFSKAFMPIIIPVVVICGLIAPSDLSSALLLFITAMIMMFIGRVSAKYIILLMFLGFVVFSMLIAVGRFFPDVIRVDTWVNRFADYVDNPDGSFQTQHAKMAIASGEWFGQGPGQSTMRNYLPAPYSDFVYATFVEEYGVFGGIFMLSLYLLLFFRIARLVTKSPKHFGAMAAIGLGLMIVIQALANMAVSVHLVPVTGLTLPMISMGGTSLLFSCIAFGIILSVSRYVEKLNQSTEPEAIS
jgi:cell division protein FtsW